MNELLGNDLSGARTVKCIGTQRIQIIDDLDVIIIDIVRDQPVINIAETRRRVVHRAKKAVSLSTVRYRLYSLECEGILSSQKTRNGVYFRLAAEDSGGW